MTHLLCADSIQSQSVGSLVLSREGRRERRISMRQCIRVHGDVGDTLYVHSSTLAHINHGQSFF